MKKIILTAALYFTFAGFAAGQNTPTKAIKKKATPTKEVKKGTTETLKTSTDNLAKKDTVLLPPIKVTAGPVPVDTTNLPKVKNDE